MKYGSVCSGVEAASLAFEPLGWQPQWFSEIDKFPSAVLQHHWPDVPNLGDMTSNEFKQRATPVDLIVGGTPCQSFSVAGLRKGLDDQNGNLALEFCRLIDRGLSGKTSLVSCHQTKEKTLVPSSGRWQKSGIIARGESWTHNTSEHPKDADVSFLSDILEPMEERLQRYCLSSTACKGILRRAEKRGKTLPSQLKEALEGVVETERMMEEMPS